MAAIKDPEIEQQARQEWLRGLVENGIDSDLQINGGLAKCRAHNSPFLPSIGQFVAWCKESSSAMSGIPSESEARMALTREIGKSSDIRQWHGYHPIVYWVYGQRESFDWKRMTVKELDEQFHELWMVALSMAKHGHQFVSPLPKSHQIDEVDLPPAPKELAMEVCASVLSMFDEPPKEYPLTPAQIADNERLERLRKSFKGKNDAADKQ